MSEVVELNVVTRLKIPAGRVTKRAAEADLDEVVVCGLDADGEFYFASNMPDAGNVLWLLETAKIRLMQYCDEGEPLQGA